MKVEWTTAAKRDHDALIDHIAQDQPLAAVEQGDEITQQIARLGEFPNMGRAGRLCDTRELVINRTPYVVAYRIKGETIHILRILHGAQQWPAQL
ncbi:MAG: type II toxin-antitoxin system RelE/ParE family toxin [Methylococcaceae bacterium]|nr:MAG: type II toxin-antitoxin system RelE/ParE family toxin [Methylococcaceae bacterium]